MKRIDKLAKEFGLEDYVNYKIENGNIYIIQEDKFGREFWLFFNKITVYKNKNKNKNWIISMYEDIKENL